MTDVRAIVYQQIRGVAAQQNKPVPEELHDGMRLLECGLDSLCTAILFANLEDRLNVDPFAHDVTDIPITIGDLIRIYDHAVAA